MGLVERLFRPKVERLATAGDIEGLRAIATSEGKLEQRIAAIDALVELGKGSVTAVLVSLLGDSEPKVADTAERVLRGLGAEAAQDLAAALATPEGDRALDLLLGIGDACAEALHEAASHDDETVRHRVISGVLELAADTDDEETHELCFRTLLASLGDREPSCRAEAAAGLATFSDPRAARALAAQLKDGDETVRTACRDTLATIGSPAFPYLIDAVADRNANSRLLAAELLAKIDSEPADVQERQAALKALLALRTSADGALTDAVEGAIRSIPATDVVEQQLMRLEDITSDEREETEELVGRLLKHGNIDPRERQSVERRLAEIPSSDLQEP
jgi:HEAT repeat protein